MRKLKTISIVIIMLLAFAAVYVEFKNMHTEKLSYRQKILHAFYPAWMWLNGIAGINKLTLTHTAIPPPVPFYDLKATAIDGSLFHFEKLKGKKVLIVNTASDCGYTGQYTQLQQLQEQHWDKLVIIGFPANDFKEQEKADNTTIATFCKRNFGVSFPLMQKAIVIQKEGQHEVYQWLSNPAQNGWNSKAPSWNFSKYLVNEQGMLTHYFDPGISPLSNIFLKALQ
ncbi:MAG TPA: glutathione peroxidase [Ferruginibacter sp.]|nr:glutathione peroxidase [Ferruginibacter sp.]HMP22328.1 glutathione peroxidase [Ferruginibacter sp.]